MTPAGFLQLLALCGLLLATTKPLGAFMARLFQGQRTFLHPVLRPLERLIYKFAGIRETAEQRWTHYAGSVLAFSLASFVFVYVAQRLQGWLPANPMGFGTHGAPANATPMTPDLAFNTAVSFVTNTNWQAYAGETTLSYFVQMAALAVQNFASAAAGVAVAIAVVRGFVRQQASAIGNFWVDLTRATVYVLLPLSLFAALVFVAAGVPQNFHGYTHAKTLEGATQVIPQGPMASQEAIKELGTNGGGFLNANSAHPYENPTPFTNFFEMWLIFAIPAALTYTFGRMAADRRQGWAVLAAMSLLFLVGAGVATWAEQAGNPIVAHAGVETAATASQPGGNMEGKETRFGIAASALFATVTTGASCGAVNSMHDSFTPLGGLVPLFNIETGEVIFGGVGSGLYGILLFAIVAVFIAGLMVGRTPEYLGKKIEQKEVKMAMLALIGSAAGILVFAALAAVVPFAQGGYGNGGPHGLAEVLYSYSSATGNNGSAFAGITVNTPWYNLTLGLAMLIGRFLFIVPMLAAAGSLASKKRIPASAGTFPTHGPLFVGLLVATVVIVGALTFFPALSLTPVVEHFLMQEGRLF
jgi:K+-transporting ATPase ATPase A chain